MAKYRLLSGAPSLGDLEIRVSVTYNYKPNAPFEYYEEVDDLIGAMEYDASMVEDGEMDITDVVEMNYDMVKVNFALVDSNGKVWTEKVEDEES